jgi:hypothetical protein
MQDSNSIQDQFGTFKICMVYAIGATQFKLTGPYNYTAPESFLMIALQFISAARESHLIYNIQALTLLVLYNLRSPSNSGIWYMIGLAMRTCVDLGLHREYHYIKIRPYEGSYIDVYFGISTSLKGILLPHLAARIVLQTEILTSCYHSRSMIPLRMTP